MLTSDAPMDLIWDVAAKTALVLALLYAVLWWIRRVNGKSALTGRRPAIQVMQSAQLGPGRTLHLIGVGEKVLLVGATSQQVSLLSEMERGDLGSLLGVQGEEEPFDRYLRQAMGAAGSLSSRLRGRLGGKDDGRDGAE